jgi:hypothetical protein
MQKSIFALCFVLVLAFSAFGQMPHDAIYMKKNSYCIAIVTSQTQWSQYWEGTLKRDNPNIGTLSTQAVSPMLALGISPKLNLITTLPYIRTQASAGNLLGQKGLQDISLWLKYKVYDTKGLSLHTLAGGTVPVGNYVAEFLPMSIGIKAKTATGRLLARYIHSTGLYAQAHISYSFRGKTKIDADSYYFNNQLVYASLAPVPNTTDSRAAMGYYNKGKQIEAFVEQNNCVSGDNIRRNAAPFPTNNMQATMLGLYAKYQPHHLGLNARMAHTTAGLNVGKSTQFSLGILWQIDAVVNK